MREKRAFEIFLNELVRSAKIEESSIACVRMKCCICKRDFTDDDDDYYGYVKGLLLDDDGCMVAASMLLTCPACSGPEAGGANKALAYYKELLNKNDVEALRKRERN